MSLRGAGRRVRMMWAAAACVLVGCGPGGNLAGIEGTGIVASGPISAFGSVFVNGVEFGTMAAAILLNGQSGSESQLRAGQIVNVVGSIDAGGKTGTAKQIQFYANVQGPIAAVNLAASTFTVLGQTVVADANTSFAADAGGTPSLASLSVGMLVEVSGFPNSNGSVDATRVDVKAQVASFLIAGTVASLNQQAHQFALNGATIDYSSAVFGGFPGNRAVQNGDYVQVSSAPGPGSFPIAAIAVNFLAGASGSEGEHGQIAGTITRFASAADFAVSGTHATTTATTVYENGSVANLALGATVEIEGHFDATGTLVADQVQFNGTIPLLLKAPVQAVNAAGNSLQIFGIQIATNTQTRFDDQSANPVSPFNLSSVQVSDYVEIRGRSDGAGGIIATFLTREIPGSTLELRGTATTAAAPNLSVLGVNGVTSATTQFFDASEQPLTGSQFYAAALGATVDLQGTLSGAVLQVATASLVGSAQVDD